MQLQSNVSFSGCAQGAYTDVKTFAQEEFEKGYSVITITHPNYPDNKKAVAISDVDLKQGQYLETNLFKQWGILGRTAFSKQEDEKPEQIEVTPDTFSTMAKNNAFIPVQYRTFQPLFDAAWNLVKNKIAADEKKDQLNARASKKFHGK